MTGNWLVLSFSDESVFVLYQCEKTVSSVLIYMIVSYWPNFKLALRQGRFDISSNFPSHHRTPNVFYANFKPVIKFRTFGVPRGFITVFTTAPLDPNVNEMNPVHTSHPYYLLSILIFSFYLCLRLSN